MNVDENLRTTPSKALQSTSVSSPATRAAARRATKNAKITNFFTKVNSPSSNKNNSNSNPETNENNQQPTDDASSSSMKAPCSDEPERRRVNKEYVFIIPSSDDDTNVSTKGSQTRRKRPASIHSNNSKSSDGFILTNTNNELGIGRKKRAIDNENIERSDSTNNHDIQCTPTRSSGRDSRSRDSMTEKRLKIEHVPSPSQNSGGPKVNRIQPTMISCRTKMVDFQSVPSDLNLPRDQAEALIRKLFLVGMPDDFYLFWEFAKTINHRKPCSAFSHPYLELNLVGPYDVLSGLISEFHGFRRDALLRHCRYYYDPPEFQTVIVKKDQLMTHYGFFRDEPSQDKPIVVVNRAALDGQISEAGDNLFTMLKNLLDTSITMLSKSSQEVPPPTFSSSSSRTSRSSALSDINKQSQLEKAKAKQELTIIRDKLLDFCSAHGNISSDAWDRTNTRRNESCSRGLNAIGISVPSGSHREIGLSDTQFKEILDSTGDMKYQKYRTLLRAMYDSRNDSTDFGRNLELGLDLFCRGDPFFHNDIEHLLSSAYTSLNRQEFIEILKSHLATRREDDKVSILD